MAGLSLFAIQLKGLLKEILNDGDFQLMTREGLAFTYPLRGIHCT